MLHSLNLTSHVDVADACDQSFYFFISEDLYSFIGLFVSYSMLECVFMFTYDLL